MARPQNITVDSESRIYVTDSYQNIVLVYDNIGTVLGAVYDLAHPLRIPLGVTIGSTDRLYVASRMGRSIERFDIGSFSSVSVTPVSLSFEAPQGGSSPAARPVTVANTGGASLKWSSLSNDGWISTGKAGGTLDLGQSESMDVSVDVSGLSAGKHEGSFSVSDGAAGLETVQVTLTVTPAPVLHVFPGALNFNSEVGTTPDPETLTIGNDGAAPLSWSLSADVEWISANKTSGTVGVGEPGADVTILVDVTGLDAGTYTGTITVTGQGAGNGPSKTDVTLKLSDPGGDPGTDPGTPPVGTSRKDDSGRIWTVMAQVDGISLNSIWGSSSINIFAVGSSGTILHYDGRTWNEEDAATTTDLNSVWGMSESSVYAVGDSGLILHYDGVDWSSASPVWDILYSAWCNSSSCKAAGQNTTLLGRTGSVSWSSEYSGDNLGTLHGVWGSSESDVFAVGAGGAILHNDGSGWSAMSSGIIKTLYGVCGSGPDNVYAVGDSGTILRYNGTNWSAMTSPITVTLLGIWGNSSGEVYAVGEDGTMLLYQGSQWQSLETGVSEHLNDAWAAQSKEIYAVGSGGSIIYGKKGFPWCLLQPVLMHNEKQK